MYVDANASRSCSEDGEWGAVNADDCLDESLDMLNTEIDVILNSAVINTTDLSAISERLSIITNTSGVSAISPTHLNTTNSILDSMIRLDFL